MNNPFHNKVSIEDTIYIKGKYLTEQEAKDNATKMYRALLKEKQYLQDYWYGLAENYDLNIWYEDELFQIVHVDLYLVTNEETDYDHPIKVL